MTKGLPGADVRKIIETLGFDPTNHHNALRCPYCNPEQLSLSQLAEAHPLFGPLNAGPKSRADK